MRNLSERKERYMRDSFSKRLGGIAANLARVRSFSKNVENENAVFELFEESKHFIEWTAGEAEIATTVEMIELQLQIAMWQCNWSKHWKDETSRDEIGLKSVDWSQRMLERSGLLEQ